MSLKSRLNRLEKDNKPPEPIRRTIVDWGDCDETPEDKAKRLADRPTHTPDGDPIQYVDISWGDDDDIPGPAVDDETRLAWAEDVIAEAHAQDEEDKAD
jgi:hypothetical protein